jgi:hypothetical protein
MVKMAKALPRETVELSPAAEAALIDGARDALPVRG